MDWIGFIWDVPIHNFLQNLIKFQDTTIVTVHIVTCNKLATRPLRIGSTHSTFVQELQSVLHRPTPDVLTPGPPSSKSSKWNPKTLITDTGKSQPEDTVDMAASIVSGLSVSGQSLSSESDVSVCGNLF